MSPMHIVPGYTDGIGTYIMDDFGNAVRLTSSGSASAMGQWAAFIVSGMGNNH